MRNIRRGMRSGFTLVEMMIVVAIIAILAGIAVPMYTKYVRKSESMEAVRLMKQIADAEATYFSTHSKYSESERVLGIEVNKGGKFDTFKIEACGEDDNTGVLLTASVGEVANSDTASNTVYMIYLKDTTKIDEVFNGYDKEQYDGHAYILDYVNNSNTDSSAPSCK
jgi:prepilin-type N-terminal cleavage/methylation domain-containing protein